MKTNMKTRWIFILFFLLFTGFAHAGNDSLAQTQAVPTGERVANYLQTMLTTVGQLLSIKHPPGLFDNGDIFRTTVLYDSENKLIEVSLIGTKNNLDIIKALLEFTKNEIMSFNKKLHENFGTTLAETDLEMSYLNVLSNKTLLRYKNGQY